jgi:hypothetical protein
MIRLAALSDVDDIARLHVKAWQVAYRGHMPDAHHGLDPSTRAAMGSKVIGQPAVTSAPMHPAAINPKE